MRNRIVIFTFFILAFLLKESALSFAGEHTVDPREAAIDHAVGGMVEGSRILTPEAGAGSRQVQQVPGKELRPSMDTRVTASGAGAPSALPAQPIESPIVERPTVEEPIVQEPILETPPVEETQIVETSPTEPLFENPLHPYTKALFSAALPAHPDIKREEIVLRGEVPSPLNPPKGCRFHPRCPVAKDVCSLAEPEYKEVEPRHWVACHLY